MKKPNQSKKIGAVALIVLGVLISAGCSNTEQKSAPVSLKMASNGYYEQSLSSRTVLAQEKSGGFVSGVEEINLEVLGAKMHFTDPCSAGDTLLDSVACNSFQGWVSIPVQTGIFNIMQHSPLYPVELVNNFIIPSGKVSQLRLLLGDNNSVKVNGNTYPLFVPSGSESGYKINIHAFILPDVYTEVLLTMNPSECVKINGNGEYRLDPVIRADFF